MDKLHKNLLNKIQNKKAVIWDFDGVIVFADWNYGNKFEDWSEKLWKLLEEFDPKIREKFKKGLKYYYEHTDYIVENFGKTAMDKINKFYLEKEMLILPVSPINYDIIDLLQNLDENIEHYIWSNNQYLFITKILNKVGIKNKFRGIISRDKVRLAKPNLDGFKIIQSLTSKPLNEFIFIGDFQNTDGAVAAKLGIDFYLYKNPNQKS